MNSYNTGPSGDLKEDGRKAKVGTSKASTVASGPKPKVEEDLSMDTIRKRIARILHGEE